MLWILMYTDRSSQYVTGENFFVMVNRPYLFGVSFCKGIFRGRFFPSNQTLSPSSNCLFGVFIWYQRSMAWDTCTRACCMLIRQSVAAGNRSSPAASTCTWGFIPNISWCRLSFITSWGQELCANLARKICGPVVLLLLLDVMTQHLLYPLIHLFCFSICLGVKHWAEVLLYASLSTYFCGKGAGKMGVMIRDDSLQDSKPREEMM